MDNSDTVSNNDIDIYPVLKELSDIITELKSTNEKAKTLREQKQEKEQIVIEYLKSMDQAGIKFRDIIIFNEERSKRKIKKMKQKHEDIKKVLRDAGVTDVEGVYQKILEQSKGEEMIVDSLKMKRIAIR